MAAGHHVMFPEGWSLTRRRGVVTRANERPALSCPACCFPSTTITSHPNSPCCTAQLSSLAASLTRIRCTGSRLHSLPQGRSDIRRVVDTAFNLLPAPLLLRLTVSLSASPSCISWQQAASPYSGQTSLHFPDNRQAATSIVHITTLNITLTHCQQYYIMYRWFVSV